MHAISILNRRIGVRVDRLRRIRYVEPDGSVSDLGPLEVSFADDTSWMLDAGADGDSLVVNEGPWHDPFTEPLSAENRDFVERSGKWTAFDVDDGDPLCAVIGRQLDRIEELQVAGKVVGARLCFGDLSVTAAVDSDEVSVVVQQDSEESVGLGLGVADSAPASPTSTAPPDDVTAAVGFLAALRESAQAPSGRAAEHVRAEAMAQLRKLEDGDAAEAVACASEHFSPTQRAELAQALHEFAAWAGQPGDATGARVDHVLARLEQVLGPLLESGRQVERTRTQQRIDSAVTDSIARRLRESGIDADASPPG